MFRRARFGSYLPRRNVYLSMMPLLAACFPSIADVREVAEAAGAYTVHFLEYLGDEKKLNSEGRSPIHMLLSFLWRAHASDPKFVAEVQL
jgi:hypothetical protein